MSKNAHYLRNRVLFFSGAFIMIFIVLLYLSNNSEIHYNEGSVRAVKGHIDLSDKLDDHTVFALDGEWEFYPQVHINTNEFDTFPNSKYTNVPGSWAYSFLPTAYKGIATYRLHVKLPNIEGQLLGIRTSNIRLDYRLIIDGKTVFANGIYSYSQIPVPAAFPRTSYFEVKGSEVEIILQINNSYLNNPGIGHSVLIGYEEIIRNLSMTKNNMDIILFAALLSITFVLLLYFWTFYSAKEFNINYLILSINTLLFAIVTSGYREKLLFQFLYNLDTGLLIKIHDFSKIGYYFSLFMLIYRVRKSVYPKIILTSTLFYLFILSGVVMLFPISIYGAYIDFMTFLLYFVFVVYLFLELNYLYKCHKNKLTIKNSFYVLGLIFLPTIYSIGILFYQSKNFWFDMWVSLSIVFYVFFMVSITFVDGVDNIRRNHQLSEEVLKNEFAFLQSQIKPHFLFNTLASIQSMIDIDMQKAHSLLNDLSDYLRSAFEFNHKKHFTSITKELHHVLTYLSIEKERYVDRFKIEIEIDKELYHASILQFSIQPLVENALRHGILVRSQFGVISIKIERIKDRIEVHILDDGVGNDKILVMLEENNESRGVGLKNIHKRLFKLYGEGLHVDSKINIGTHIWFSYPYSLFEEQL